MLLCADCHWTFSCVFLLAGDTVKIGEISYKLKTPQSPELVPVKHSMWFSVGVLTVASHKREQNQWIKGVFLLGSASFRLTASDSCSAPTMDYAERPFGTRCVPHWSPGAPETIYSYAVSCEYGHSMTNDKSGNCCWCV